MTGPYQLEDIQRTVGRIEGKLDSAILEMAATTLRAERLETRVRSIESRQHWYSGAAAAFGAMVGYFTSHKF